MLIIGQVSGKESFERKFEIPFNDDQLFRENHFIDKGDKAWVINCDKECAYHSFNYGMVPFWSKKAVYHYQSPIEGSINPGAEMVKKRIIVHPSFRRPIRENRCLVPADYFITLNESGEPYLVFLNSSKTFALAGIYDNWKEDYYEKDFYQGFSILSLNAPEDFQKVGIKRLPLVLPERKYRRWMNPEIALAEITALMENTLEDELNAYPIRRKLFDDKLNSKELCKATGDMLRALPEDPGKMAAFLRSFRFKRGLTHPQQDQQERTWRA